MFDKLSERLSEIFRQLGGKGRLDEQSIREGLREVRLALLEADVNFKVVKDFTEKAQTACLGLEVGKGFTPAQRIVQVVNEELTAMLGGASQELHLEGKGPHAVMLVGLQGSGKTTSAAKLARWLQERRRRPYLVPADVYRPAAIEQLTALAGKLGLPCFASSQAMNPLEIARAAKAAAKENGCDVLLLDTAGRLHIDQPLMSELAGIKQAVSPVEILFVADAMTGQEAVTVAEAFDRQLGLTGVILTKMDGDARGGAALSIKAVTGKNVKFVGVGEKISDLEVFYPDRIAGRILGMGDMLTLMEKTQDSIAGDEAEELAGKLRKAEFDLEDFRAQLRRMKKLGPLEGLLKLIPGFGELRRKLGESPAPEKELLRTEAIINSMTQEERRNPKLINGRRKLRIAGGSGTSVAQVNHMLKQFEGMRGMMRDMLGGKRTGGGGPLSGLGLGGKMGTGFPGPGGLALPPGADGVGTAHAKGGLSKNARKKKKQLRKAGKKRKK
ncbi:MAG: signal recognition particle protein [Deltaproteobacteria bacterium]|jgi:signal recognition particle subunit SRP54|nr:signal recognition particle protein [Deltaproteobacteria bacterium]